MAFVKSGERFWTAKTRTEVETQFGNADDFPKDSIVRIVTGSDAGDYYWDPTSSATAGAGVIAVPGETGRFLLGSSASSTPSVSSSAAGSAVAWPAGEVRIFHSDGSTAGGTWAQLTDEDVAEAFEEKAITPAILAVGSNGQILTTVSGAATWAAPATVTSSAVGVANAFPASVRRIFHSDGSTAGGTWAQLTSTDVTAAFADASIGTAKINVGSGTEGQVAKIVSGVVTFADESGTGASPVTSSVSGTANAFTASTRRIFHSDGTTAGGVWTQLTSDDVEEAFAAGAIGAPILTPGSNGQVLTTSGGVATWAAPATVALVGTATAGTAVAFPASVRRILHSDGSTAGGTWSQLTATDVTGAFAPGAIGAGIITAGSNGQILTTSGGVTTWAAPAAAGLVSSSVAGTASAFTGSARRIFHSDGTTNGGTWAQLAEVDVTGAFAAASMIPGIVKPGTNGQVLTTSGGVATWATPTATAFVSSSVTGTAAAFPAGSRRLFHSDGSTAGGIWTQMTEADVTGAFAAASMITGIIKPGTNGQILTTSGGVATWAAPEISISGAANGDLIRRASGAWARLPILNTPNAPLLSISGLPEWSPLNVGPTVNLGSGSVSGASIDMSTYGDNRVVYLDATGPVSLVSINEIGFRHGPYVFINVSDHTITLQPDGSTDTGFILPTGLPLALPSLNGMLAHYYGDGSIRDFYVMQMFDSAGLSELLIAGSIGEMLVHNGTKWVRLPPASNSSYKLMSGGPLAPPSWQYDNDGATVIFKPGDTSSDRNVFSTWTNAFNAAVAHGAPASIFVESVTGATVSIPAGTWDGKGRVGVFFVSKYTDENINVSIASGAEIHNITAWAAPQTWPSSDIVVNVDVAGTSTNSCAIYHSNTSGRGIELLLSGEFNWTGARTYAIKTQGGQFRFRDLKHTGLGIRSTSGMDVTVEGALTPPALSSDSGSPTLRIRQKSGADIRTVTFGWTGTISYERTDYVASLVYTPENTDHWPEGSTVDPNWSIDKLAARNPGQLPPGANVFHNHWFSFGQNTEGLDVNSSAESVTLWVPAYNHWLLLGFQSTNTTTDHRHLRVGYGRSIRNLNHSGFWDFLSGDSISSNFKRPVSAIVVPDGDATVRVVVSAQMVSSSNQCVATSDDGGQTWTLRVGSFGVTTNGYRDMCWTGTHLIGIGDVSSNSVGRSSNRGTTWSGVTVGTLDARVKAVSNGSGIVLLFALNGNYDRSADHGSSWGFGTLSGFGTLFDAIWFDGRFIVMNTSGNIRYSTDGTTWFSATKAISHPGKTSFTPHGYAYRSLVKCGGVLACLFTGVYDRTGVSNVEIFYSYDGITWHDSSVMSGVIDGSFATSSTRFATHLASSSPNSASDAETSVHQICCRLSGMQYDDFDIGSRWALSSAVQSSHVV